MAQKSTVDSIVENKPLMIIGAGVLAYFLVIKPSGTALLEKLGLKKTQDQLQNDAAATNQNAWNPVFWKSGPGGTLLLTQAVADGFATAIYNAFTIWQDDYNAIVNVVKQCKTKSQVSFIAYAFQNKYKQDMYEYMRDPGGINPWDGLSDEHLTALNNYVSKLPDYKA